MPLPWELGVGVSNPVGDRALLRGAKATAFMVLIPQMLSLFGLLAFDSLQSSTQRWMFSLS